MPFYDFHCQDCDREFNVMCSIAELTEKRVVCPDCESKELTRIYRPVQVAVKSEGGVCPSGGMPCPHAGGCGCGIH